MNHASGAARSARGDASGDGRSLEKTSTEALRRRMIAQICRALDPRQATPAPRALPPLPHPRELQALPPRQRQTLARLLAGDSEKQIARRLRISPHTVHVYVKALYRQFQVNSRGELLARFVNLAPGKDQSTTDAERAAVSPLRRSLRAGRTSTAPAPPRRRTPGTS